MKAAVLVAAFGCLYPTQALAASTDVNKPVMSGQVTISAASSLTDAFIALGKEFRKLHKDLKVRFNFGSSSTLVAQIQSGAPSDILAAADLISIEKLVAMGNVVVMPRVFARNTMMIAVKPGNPMSVKSVQDLTNLDVVSLCGKTVPCGVYSASVLARSGVVLSESKVTRGVDAKSALGAVISGDADAALIYRTDVLAAKKTVTGVAIPRSINVVAMYGIVPIRGAHNLDAAKAFIDFVLSEQGWKILKSFGFEHP